MNYHNITKDDMLNGSGLRVCLWLSGCNHHCKGCHNPETWDPNSGIKFDKDAKNEIFEQLSKDYISGITFTGGDPLHIKNAESVRELVEEIKEIFPQKNIWIYTGYTWENIRSLMRTHFFAPCRESYYCIDITKIIRKIDVLVDGEFQHKLADINFPYAGSTNQRIIDVPSSLVKGEIVIWKK